MKPHNEVVLLQWSLSQLSAFLAFDLRGHSQLDDPSSL